MWDKMVLGSNKIIHKHDMLCRFLLYIKKTLPETQEQLKKMKMDLPEPITPSALCEEAQKCLPGKPAKGLE